MSDCIFCAVASGEAERSLAHEDDLLVVVMDIHPINPGHALVLPRPHATYLADLDENTTAQLFVAALRTATALRSSGLRCEGVNLFVADGEAAGQEVGHVHVHVIPRFHGDGFRISREGGGLEPQPRAELDRVAQQLRVAWGSTE